MKEESDNNSKFINLLLEGASSDILTKDYFINTIDNSTNYLFKISFKPYDITFKRKSNFKDPVIDNIENNINELLKKFKTQNTIFCTK